MKPNTSSLRIYLIQFHAGGEETIPDNQNTINRLTSMP